MYLDHFYSLTEIPCAVKHYDIYYVDTKPNYLCQLNLRVYERY